MENIAHPPAEKSAAAGESEPAAGDFPMENSAKKLDLSKLPPPGDLEEYRLEEITIDGICGVY